MKTKDIYLCYSCDHTTDDGMPLELSGLEEYEHHKSMHHSVKIKQVQSAPKQTSQKLAKFATKSMIKVVKSRSDATRIFAIVKVNSHYETIELDKKNPRSAGWLQVAYFDESGQMCSEEQCTTAIGFLRQKALMNETTKQEEIHLRCAFVDNEIYYDLGRSDWKIIKISKDELRYVDYGKTTPIFTRTNRIAKQSEPNLNPDIDALSAFAKLVRVTNSEIFKVHLISQFVANLPMPFFAIRGHSGSAKTSTSSMLKRIIDPSGTDNKANLKSFPHGEDNFVVSLAGSYMSAFENISHIDRNTSDMLCRAITGGSFEKRAHYSNDEVFSISILRKILINGISFDIKEADLADRVIIYNFQRIQGTERISEKKIEVMFRKMLPDILGQIFLILQKSLQIVDVIEETLTFKERMSDFTVFGEAIFQSMGNKHGEFLALYQGEIKKNLVNLHDSNPIVRCFEHVLDKKNQIEIPAERLFQQVKTFVESEGYADSKLPKNASGIQSWVDRSKTLLDECRISITCYYNTRSKESSGFTPNSKIFCIKRAEQIQTKLEESDR